MKRSRIGAWLLLILLILGAVSSWAVTRFSRPIEEQVAQAGEAALREDWAAAEALALEGKERWDACRDLCAALADHGPMENINGLFAQLEVYIRSRDARNFAALCARLSQDLRAFGEAHSLKWWNLL